MSPEEVKAMKASKAECYTCASCKGHFKKGRGDKEAWAECEENLDRGINVLNSSREEIVSEGIVIVCDDCYLKLKERAPWLA